MNTTAIDELYVYGQKLDLNASANGDTKDWKLCQQKDDRALLARLNITAAHMVALCSSTDSGNRTIEVWH